MTNSAPAPTRVRDKWIVAFIALALSPFIVGFLLVYGLVALLIHVALWVAWVPFGRRVLFVYSNSPVWQEYIEQNLIPRLPKRSLVLNWSDRKQWKRWSLARLAFAFFGGEREFNPLALVVRPFRWTKSFRFWQPFRDFKHGNTEPLAKLEREFFAMIESESR